MWIYITLWVSVVWYDSYEKMLSMTSEVMTTWNLIYKMCVTRHNLTRAFVSLLSSNESYYILETKNKFSFMKIDVTHRSINSISKKYYSHFPYQCISYMKYKTNQPFFSIKSLQNFSGMTDSMTSIMFCEWFLYQIIHPPIKLLFLHSTSMFRKLGSISPSYVYLFLWNSSLHSLSLQNRPSNFSSLIYEDVNNWTYDLSV